MTDPSRFSYVLYKVRDCSNRPAKSGKRVRKGYRGTKMVETSSFGTVKNSKEATLYTITNKNGMKAAVTDFGAILVKLMVPDAKGKLTDVALGFDSAKEYEEQGGCFGATVGPSANRIKGAKFVIDGVTYELEANESGNNLHSNKEKGYQKRIWKAEASDNSVCFFMEDEDGSMGFPGNKKFQVTYTLDDENALHIKYHAESDKDTVINPTNHSYFNLKGEGEGTIEDHELWLNASHYTPVEAGSIPTGEIAPVAKTPMDFTVPKTIGQDLHADFEQLLLTSGYDHNWVLDDWDGSLRHFATVTVAGSQLKMKVYTTLPGVQLYTGNYVDCKGKGGKTYVKRGGLCLETQYFPNSINTPNFPSCVFGPDRAYDSETVYSFS